jgi:SAM-dependent methyltransferase
MDRLQTELATFSHDMNVKETSCPACDGMGHHLLMRRNGFPIVRCETCQTLYACPRPVESDIARLYERFPQLSQGREGHVVDDPEDGRWEAEYRLRRLLSFVSSGHLLDLGCGQGDFLVTARSHFDVQGVDLCPRLRPEAQGIPVFRGRLEDAPFPAESFETISAVEVFEHLFDPRRTLREVYRFLKPGGIFLLQTGDADSFRRRLNSYTWTYLQPPVHLNVFSREGLRRMREEVGFEPLASWSFGRAPKKVPLLQLLWRSPALRPALDLSARGGLIGAMSVWRKRA